MKEFGHAVGNLLLNKDVDIIGHQCNCQNTFGSGIARSIREMYPEAYAADTRAHSLRQNTLGSLSFARIRPETSAKHGTKIKFIFNLYGQNLFGRDSRQTDYEAIYSALELMANDITKNPLFDSNFTVGFPYKMASDRGGARWEIIENMIGVAFENYPGNVIIVKFFS